MWETLLTALVFTLVIWYAQFHWKRRQLYRMARQRPGPLSLPFIGSAWYFIGSTSDILEKLVRLSQEFTSPVPVWLGSMLCFGVWGPEDLEAVMNSPHALEKGKLYHYLKPMVGDGIFAASVPKWKRHRKIIIPTFNQRILDGFVDLFAQQSEILVTQLAKEAGKGIFDAMFYLNRCTVDIICETSMGVSVHAQTTDSDYAKCVNRGLEIVTLRAYNIFYQSDFIFKLSPLSKELNGVLRIMHDFTSSIIKEKREAHRLKVQEALEYPEVLFEEEVKPRKNFLQLLIELSEDGEMLTDKELLDEVHTFLIAGSDTTSTMSSFTLLMLGMHPEIQKRVYEEVLDVLGPSRPVECEDLGKLQYLEMVLKETMRLFPAGPLLGRLALQDIKLATCTIPTGSNIGLAILALHRDPAVWPDPLRFDPERFLPEEVAKRHPYSWVPFSAGLRNCVGPKYAYMAMKTIIATVIRQYRISTDYKSIEDIKLKCNALLKPHNGYRLSIEQRLL